VVLSSGSPSVCTVSQLTVSLISAGTCIVLADQEAAPGYTAAPQATQSFTVSPLEAQTISFTSTPPGPAYVSGTYSVTATGGTSGNPVVFSAGAPAVCSVSGNQVDFLAAGTCLVHADQAGAPGYASAEQVVQSFTVSALQAQVIQFTSTPPSPAYVGSTYAVSATGGGSGKPVTFGSSSATVCGVSGSIVSLLTPGTCTLLADQAAGPGYTAASQATQSFTVSPAPILFAFAGFFQPVDNNGILNVVKAGAAVPVKFSLGGYKGMNILQGTPSARAIACSTAQSDAIETTVAASSSGLQYDAPADQYIYVWKSESSWKNSCRRFTLALTDGSVHTADFQFNK
jgi:hypothetical protein